MSKASAPTTKSRPVKALEMATASTTMVHVRLKKATKAQAEKALEAMGLSLSDAVRALLVRIAVEKALPFDLRVPNAKTRAAMREARSTKLHRAKDVSSLMTALNADD